MGSDPSDVPGDAQDIRRLKVIAGALTGATDPCAVCDGQPDRRENWGVISERPGGQRELLPVMVHFRGVVCHVHDGKHLQFSGVFPASEPAAAVKAHAVCVGWRVVEVCGPAAVAFLLRVASRASRSDARGHGAECSADAAEIERQIVAKRYTLRDVALVVVDLVAEKVRSMGADEVPPWLWGCVTQVVRCCGGDDHVLAAASASTIRHRSSSWVLGDGVGMQDRLRVAGALEDVLDCFSQVTWTELAARAVSRLGGVEALEAAFEARRICGVTADLRYPGTVGSDE